MHRQWDKHASRFIFDCLNLVLRWCNALQFFRREWPRQEQKNKKKQNHYPYQSRVGVAGSGLFLSGWRYRPGFPFCTYYIWNGTLFLVPPPSFPNSIGSLKKKKSRQVVRVDRSWMDFLSPFLPPFLFHKAQGLVFHWLQSPSIWMVVCVLSEQRGERPLKRC